MKKVLLVAALIFSAYFLASIKAEAAYAIEIRYGAIFKNGSGQVPVTVYYRISDLNGYVTLFNGQTTNSTPQIGSGQSYAMVDWSTGNFNRPYTLTWWTDCADPNVPAAYQDIVGQVGVVTFGSDGSYANGLKVHAENPCGEPVINSISCPTPGTSLTF